MPCAYSKNDEKRTIHFVEQLRVYYVKPGATGLISHGRDEKISKFSVIKKKTEEKRPLG
jgi:hypothetical protein